MTVRITSLDTKTSLLTPEFFDWQFGCQSYSAVNLQAFLDRSECHFITVILAVIRFHASIIALHQSVCGAINQESRDIDLTGLFWTKHCENMSLERSLGYAEEEI